MSESGSNKPSTWVRAYIGLGSNEGDRVGFVQQAMQFLKDHQNIEVVECSSFYETEPVGNEYVEWFVNAVAAIETELTALELMEACKGIEMRLAALAGADGPDVFHNTPEGVVKARIIDLDILFYGEDRIRSKALVVPHPSMEKRAYQLVPLLEIAPDLVHPVLNKSLCQIHEDLPAPEQIFLYGTREAYEDLDQFSP